MPKLKSTLMLVLLVCVLILLLPKLKPALQALIREAKSFTKDIFQNTEANPPKN